MRFENPILLWLLLVLPPAMIAFLWWAGRRRRALLGQFIKPRLLADLLAGVSPVRRQARGALAVVAVICLLFTLARPQWGFDWEEIKRRGLDIVVAIDTSKSMLAEDIAPNRLTRAKLAALDLMQQAKSDRLGLVAFAGDAFMECPLTIDDVAFRQCVENLDVNTLPLGGTAIAEAIETAAKSFKYEADNYKVLVILTDGEDHDPRAVEAGTQAAKAGMKIFTIGIGSAEGELLNPNLVRDEQGNVVKSRLNERLLQEIATVGNGFYLPLRGAKTMETLYERGLAPLPKTEGQAKLVKRWHERYHWPLAAAILLLITEVLLPERARAKKNGMARAAAVRSSSFSRSEPRGSGAPNAAAAGTTLTLALLLAPLATSASPSQALREYRAGKYAAAQKEFERLAREDKQGDLRLEFNAGVAAYRATNYDAAVRHFKLTLGARDLKLQAAAYFNLGNTQFRLGTAAKDLDALQESWEAAIKSYQNAVALDKRDTDAAFNLAFVTRAVEQIKLLREAARRAKEEADDAVRRRNYHRALEIMEQLVQQNIAAKPFEEFTRKLKNIDEIATPAQP
jgi:Ca-activated chloride channel family protein